MTKQRRILSAVLALAMTGMSFSGVVNADSVNENNSDVIEKWTNMTDEESEKEWQSYQFIFDIHQKVKEAFNEKLTGYVYSFGIYTNPDDPSKSIEYIEVGDEKTKEEVINILTEAGISESYYEVNISQAGPPQILVATASNTDTQNIIYGDLNDDGTADLTDLTLLSLYLMKSADFTDSQIEAADIDGSGEVDIADLAYFKQYVCKDAAVASKIRIGIKNNDDHGNIQDGGDYSKVEHEQGEEGFSGAREATPEQIAESLNQPEKD